MSYSELALTVYHGVDLQFEILDLIDITSDLIRNNLQQYGRVLACHQRCTDRSLGISGCGCVRLGVELGRGQAKDRGKLCLLVELEGVVDCPIQVDGYCQPPEAISYVPNVGMRRIGRSILISLEVNVWLSASATTTRPASDRSRSNLCISLFVYYGLTKWPRCHRHKSRPHTAGSHRAPSY